MIVFVDFQSCDLCYGLDVEKQLLKCKRNIFTRKLTYGQSFKIQQ
jgi:hypothetical protein